jgi:predicted TIM-barrel fold metal-dependent hydrolase
MRIIDAHTHVFPQYAELAVQVMDRCGIERSVTLEWHNGFGSTLLEHLAIFNRYPGRFTVFGNIDFRRINDLDFGRLAAEQMEKDAASGMRGLKIYKALGLEHRQTNDQLWPINDPRLDPIWAKAGELGIPILLHTGDPPAFWQPVTERNFWNGVLYGEYAWWTYYRKGFPSLEELLGERNEVIARHPSTIFICPHVGSRSESLQLAADDLDDFPNLYYDVSARIPVLGLPSHSLCSRQFLTKYQDRILFGTDAIYDDTNVPTGVQAQCLYQPGELGPAGNNPERSYVESTVRFIESHYRFFQTDEAQHNPPFKRSRSGYSIRGLGLEQAVVEKLFWKNADRLIPG